MEQYANINTGGWFNSHEKKLIRIKNFEISIQKEKNKEKDKEQERIEEAHMHVKNIVLNSINSNEFMITRLDNKDKYQFKFSNEVEALNLFQILKTEKDNYESFIKEFYSNNDIYSLIEGDSIMNYFDMITAFIEKITHAVDNLKIDPKLIEILELQNDYIEKIFRYTKIIKENFKSLKQEKPEDKELCKKTQEMMTMLNELKTLITSCTFNTTHEWIEKYVETFKNIIKQKSSEILLLIDEIKYNLSNYLALKSDTNDNLGNKNQDDEITKLKLENENLKIQIENIDIENSIITQFIKDCKAKKKAKAAEKEEDDIHNPYN